MRRAARNIWSNIAANWELKAALSVALTLFFCIPYFALQQFPVFPIRRLPLSALDEAIGFEPRWVWMYQSVYLLLSVPPWLARSGDDLRRYARGFVLLACLGFGFFLLLPIEGPRSTDITTDVMFRLLVSYDSPLNSFPSLHVGLSVYTVLFALRISRGRTSAEAGRTILGGLITWTLAIAFAALATKQHYAVDLPAGALLASMCDRFAWKPSQRSAHAQATMVRARLVRASVQRVRNRHDSGGATAAADQSTGGSGSRVAS